jgi:hypothetical protein
VVQAPSNVRTSASAVKVRCALAIGTGENMYIELIGNWYLYMNLPQLDLNPAYRNQCLTRD